MPQNDNKFLLLEEKFWNYPSTLLRSNYNLNEPQSNAKAASVVYTFEKTTGRLSKRLALVRSDLAEAAWFQVSSPCMLNIFGVIVLPISLHSWEIMATRNQVISIL